MFATPGCVYNADDDDESSGGKGSVGGSSAGGNQTGGSSAGGSGGEYLCGTAFDTPPREEWDPICLNADLPPYVVGEPTSLYPDKRPVLLTFRDGMLASVDDLKCTFCFAPDTEFGSITRYDTALLSNCETNYACGPNHCPLLLAVSLADSAPKWQLYGSNPVPGCEAYANTAWELGPANVPGFCVPSCGSNSCGLDGCGGTCGPCPAGSSCDNGSYCTDPNGCAASSSRPCCNSCSYDCGVSNPNVSLDEYRACIGACIRCCENCGF
jgi:hypothetical protein